MPVSATLDASAGHWAGHRGASMTASRMAEAGLSRRTLARGVAWAVPAIAVVSAAPAMAVSYPPSLQGWIYWTRRCTRRTATLGLDGNGPSDVVYPSSDYGFYVFNTTATTNLTNACVTWSYSPAYDNTLTWTAQSDSGSHWSAPTQISSGPPTFQTCYSGAWTFVPASGGQASYSITNEIPHFVGTATTVCQARTISITRSVSVDGTQISFNRTVYV